MIRNQRAYCLSLHHVKTPQEGSHLQTSKTALACMRAQSLSCVKLFVTPWTVALKALCPQNFSGKNTGVGCHFLLQGIFQIQGSNLCLFHLLYQQVDSLLLAPPGQAEAGIYPYLTRFDQKQLKALMYKKNHLVIPVLNPRYYFQVTLKLHDESNIYYIYGTFYVFCQKPGIQN